jgi:hypothetical protein
LHQLAIATENAAVDRAYNPKVKREEDFAKETAKIRKKITEVVEIAIEDAEGDGGNEEGAKVFDGRFPPAQLAKLDAQIEQTKQMIVEVESGVEAVDWLPQK